MNLKTVVVLVVGFLIDLVPIKAKFYIEYTQVSLAVLERTGKLGTELVLSECSTENYPLAPGQTPNIRCRKIDSPDAKSAIYDTVSFYETFKPKLANIWPVFFDNKLQPALPTQLMIGLIPDDVDQPNFEDFSADAARFQLKAGRIGPPLIPEGTDGARLLAPYLAINNIAVFSTVVETVTVAYPIYLLLLQNVWLTYRRHKRPTCSFRRGHSPSGANTQNELEQLRAAIPILLPKMIDPCSFMPPCVNGPRPQGQPCPADTFCAVYCLFINTVTSLHIDTPPKCKMLKGGSCSDRRCVCQQQKPVVRKIGKSSRVNLAHCNNALRHLLDRPASRSDD